MQHSQSQDNLNFIFSPSMSSFVHPPPTAFPPAQPDDANSPILFKDNINLVQTQISMVRSLAHEALNAMWVAVNSFIELSFSISADEDIALFSKGAYQPGSSPTHAAGMNVLLFLASNKRLSGASTDSLVALRQCLGTLNELMYTTGVGSLPLLPPEATQPFTEEQLAEQANKAISTLFTLHTRMQDTATVAASIMAAPEQALRR
jgi:hypothetical protein